MKKNHYQEEQEKIRKPPMAGTDYDTQIKEYLVRVDPMLQILFNAVPTVDFNSIIKPVYVALIGAILGQKISYKAAKALRGKLYIRCGTNFYNIKYKYVTE
jgi:3-methyladenine DNA glycosylase/8-oxoguanine DNA glycosylase